MTAIKFGIDPNDISDDMIAIFDPACKAVNDALKKPTTNPSGDDSLNSPYALDLQDRISRWQMETFGSAQTINAIDCHLIQEFSEFLEAPSPTDEAEEMADLVILLMGRATIMGINLIAETERKLAINKTRKWAPPDDSGVIHHLD